MQIQQTKMQIVAEDATEAAFRKIQNNLAGVEGAMTRVERAAGSMGPRIDATTRAWGANRMAVQNTSYQITDFIVQVQGGTSAMRAMSMQLPQLLAGFGPWAAVIGVATAAIPAMASALLNSVDAAKEFKNANEDADKAFSALTQIVQTVDFSPLFKQYNDADAQTRKLITSQVELRYELLKTAIETGKRTLASSLAEGGSQINVLPGFNSLEEKANVLQEKFGLIGAAGVSFRETLSGLKDGTIDAASAFQTLAGIIPLDTKEGREFISTLSKAADEQLRFSKASKEYASARAKMAGAGATGKIDVSEEALKNLKDWNKKANALRDKGEIDALIERDRQIKAEWKATNDYRNELLDNELKKIKKWNDDALAIQQKGEAEAALEKYNRRMGELKAIVTDDNDELKKSTDFSKEFGLTFNSALEDAIVNGNDLRGVVKGLGQDIARVIVRKSITEPLGNAASSIFGNIFGKIFGGGTQAPAPVVEASFASGTNYVPRDMIAQIHRGERIVPAAQNNDSTAAQINVHFHINALDARSVSQLLAQSEPRRMITGIIEQAYTRAGRSSGMAHV